MNPAKKEWSYLEVQISVQAFTTFRIYNHGGGVMDNKLYCFGGYLVGIPTASETIINDTYCYNMSSKTIKKVELSELTRRPKHRVNHAAAVIHNCLAIMGGKGENSEPRTDFWILSLSNPLNNLSEVLLDTARSDRCREQNRQNRVL